LKIQVKDRFVGIAVGGWLVTHGGIESQVARLQENEQIAKEIAERDTQAEREGKGALGKGDREELYRHLTVVFLVV
jgi:hypothetical protein